MEQSFHNAHVYQIIALYILNIYTLFLNYTSIKLGGKKYTIPTDAVLIIIIITVG